MLGLAAIVAADGPVVVVIVITAMASVAGTAERPAAIALLPRLVGESKFGPANALLHTAQDVGVVTGPAVGALLLAVSSDWVAFVANAVTFAASATLISTMRTRGTPTGDHHRESVGSQLRHGMRTARMTPYVVPLMIVIAMAELTYGAQTVQLVLYAAAAPRRRCRRIRLPARRGGARWTAQHHFQRTPRGQHEGFDHRRR